MGEANGRDAQVTIVGAGPTGLLAAILLRRAGIEIRIIDKAPSAAKESRAFAVQARTLEILHTIGLAETFLNRGALATGVRLFMDGKLAAAVPLDGAGRTDTPFPVVLTLPQSETEAILVAELQRQGVEVERGITATALGQDSESVTLEAADAAGRALTIRSDYLVGADGAHSLVRKALGLAFEGAPYAQTFLLADCQIEGPLEDGPFCAFFHDSDFAMWFPLRGERLGRVITTSRRAVTDPSIADQGSSAATLPEVEDSFRRATQLDLRLTDATWVSRYRVHHRGVDRYGIVRVFVAGDAAHIHSPAGGQGMNTGLQDAANLAWKLTLALKGNPPPSLLGSYDGERRPVGRSVLAATDRMFSFATPASGWVSTARDVLLPLLLGTLGRSGIARSRAFDFLSELGIRYPAGDAVADAAPAKPRWVRGPKAGERAPDAPITHRRTVFDLLAGYRFHLLALSRAPLSGSEIERWAAELDGLAREAGFDPGTHLVGHSLAGRHPAITQVENAAVLDAYGLSDAVPQALYLVRPDGYVGWRAPALDLAGCARFIAARFSRPRTP